MRTALSLYTHGHILLGTNCLCKAAVRRYLVPGLRYRIRPLIRTDRKDAIRPRDRKQVEGERVRVRRVGVSRSGRGCSREGGKTQSLRRSNTKEGGGRTVERFHGTFMKGWTAG
jgi:hypothetical protein